MHARVTRQRRDPLVQLRVVLHRARAERVEAGVEVEVAARDAVVVAHDLRLGDLRQAGALGAQHPARDQLVQRLRRHVDLGQLRRPAALDRALEDRHDGVALHRGLPFMPVTSAPLRSAATAAPSTSASRSMCSRERRSVIATSRPSVELRVLVAERVAGVHALLGAAAQHRLHRRVEPQRELAHDGLLVQQPHALHRRQALPRVGGALRHQLAQLDDPAAARASSCRSRPRARSAAGWCRCSTSPSRAGCAARASAA